VTLLKGQIHIGVLVTALSVAGCSSAYTPYTEEPLRPVEATDSWAQAAINDCWFEIGAQDYEICFTNDGKMKRPAALPAGRTRDDVGAYRVNSGRFHATSIYSDEDRWPWQEDLAFECEISFSDSNTFSLTDCSAAVPSKTFRRTGYGGHPVGVLI
jgi:hypothetical protein